MMSWPNETVPQWLALAPYLAHRSLTIFMTGHDTTMIRGLAFPAVPTKS